MSFVCEFCGKDFSLKKSLLVHQKKSKDCLNIQNNIKKCFICKQLIEYDKNPSHMLICYQENRIKILESENKLYIDIIDKLETKLNNHTT